MPTTIHESFSEQVSNETKAQLDRIASGNDELEIAHVNGTDGPFKARPFWNVPDPGLFRERLSVDRGWRS